VSLMMPTATALALADQRSRAGAASGLMGLAQFGLGGAIAPLASIGGASTVVMTVSMVGSAAAALAVRVLVARVERRSTAVPAEPATADDR
jgi:DHA1 family bicyclomycin/chloramphenicol resistance-like MFS transporter